MNHTFPARCRLLASTLIGLGIVSSAAAVQINPDGKGQALIYPYYTARSTSLDKPYVTLLTVTNSTNRAKAMKVRFIEGKGGAVALDFTLYLGQYDVWTAGILSAGEGAGIFTNDHSCTSPTIGKTGATTTPFINTAYASDPLGPSLDRTNEGYIEILEMATIASGSALESAVTPNTDFSAPNASRPSCLALPLGSSVPSALTRPTGGLQGTVSLINVTEGTDFAIDAVALSQWSDKVQWGAPGTDFPTLGEASPPVSYVVNYGEVADVAYMTTWLNGRDAVSALFMVDKVTNDFTIERNLHAATDWVVTAPTKRLLVDTTRALPPFQSKLGSSGSCDQVGGQSEFGDSLVLEYFDREGATPGYEFCAPIIPCIPAQSLCNFANVIGFKAAYVMPAKVFNSSNHQPANVVSNVINGYASLEPGPSNSIYAHQLNAPAGSTILVPLDGSPMRIGATVIYHGLPLMGFAAQSYTNGTLKLGDSTVLSNYGTTFKHRFSRRIEVMP